MITEMATNATSQGTCAAEILKSSNEMSPQQQQQQHQTTTPTLNNLLPSGTDGGITPGTPVYNMTPQGLQSQNVQQQMQISPHIQHMLVPAQPNFASSQPSPLANGSYSNAGSVTIQKGSVKGKAAGRSDSRDVVFSPAAGQNGPPSQMPLHVQSSPLGTAVSGALRMEIPSSSSALAPQQMQQQVPNQQSMGQMPSSAYSAGMYPSYWPSQQMRYIQPGNVHPHYYPVQSQGPMPPSAFTGYSMPQGARQMIPANSAKIQQPSQIEIPRLPNGPMPSEWQSRINTPKSLSESVQQTSGQLLTTSSGMTAPSPGGTSSAADESLEDSKSLPGASPNPWPHTPSQISQGHRTPVPANRPNTPTVNKRQDPTSIIDRLVGPITPMNPQHIMPERRAFFEKLVQFCEQQGEPIMQVPQVSKQTVDLHRLYLAVMKRGGFEQVTRDKTWKQVCTEANSEMSESSAAGYQLRRHYQKYLLGLECLETGKNASEVVAFAERLKKRRKDNKDHNAQQYPGPGQPGPAGYGHLGDPNAAYFYGNVDPSMQGRLQAPIAWQPQGYPSGPAVTGPPNAPLYHPGMRPSAPMRSHLPPQMMQQSPVIDEQQRYEEQQRQHYFHQQQGVYAVQQQLPRTATPSSTLQADNQQGQGSHSRAPSTGPPLVTTPDSNSRHSAEESTSLRPPSHPQQVPNVTTSCNIPPSIPVQQQPSVPYYGQPHTPQMYGAAGLRSGTGPPGTLSMKTGNYHQTYPQSQPGYSTHNYQEGYQTMHPAVATQMYQQQMWNSQQMQRYSGPHANVPTSSSMGNTQMNVAMVPRVSGTLPPEMQQHYAARRSPFCLQTPGPTIATTVPGTAARLRYSAPPSNSMAHQQLQSQYPSNSMMQGGRLVGAASNPFPHIGPSTSTGFTGVHGVTGSLGQSASSLNVLPSGMHTNASGAGAGAGAAMATIMHPPFSQFTQPQSMQFPAGSVEATTISQRRRRKLVMKDLMRVNTKRIMMALRSGLETETTWALNALNVMLYDDYAPPTVLNHTPGLLNVLVEHFRAYLSLLYPKVFEVGAESKARTADDECNEFSLQSSKQERTTASSLVTSRSLKNEPTNFTKISRTGRTVHIEKKELPECLKRARPVGWSCDILDETLSLVYHESRMSSGLGGETSSYLAARLVADIEFEKQLKKPRFFMKEVNGMSKMIEANIDEVAYYSKIDKSMRIFPSNIEKSGNEDDYKKVVELKTIRPTALCVRDESRLQLVRRCLAVSNVLRGLSFLPGNEGPMAKHIGLLYIIGRLLRLYTDERTLKLPGSLVKQLSKNDEIQAVLAVGTLSEANRRLMEPGDLLESDDDNALLLFETACQLREDAFVILVHISVQLDLVEFESDVAWPLFDALIHWCVSKSAEAKDPLISAGVSPRNYALEALCKLSVIEHNVDLLLSTGPWSRLESFIKMLVGLLALNEEIPSREFAIVILCALCTISEPTCYVVAAESPAVHYLVAFLEMGDANMHQIAQQHGIQALRDNPEMMGTSVPMLRRAASILQQLCKVPACRQHLIRHQQRLLQFTMSHLMDSRVGQTITNVLYAMQYFSDKDRKNIEKGGKKDEEGCQRKENIRRENDDVKSLKNELESKDFSASNSTKCPAEHNGIPRALVENADACGDYLRQTKDDTSLHATKKQKLENGLLNYLPSTKGNITSPSAPNSLKSLVNGDVKAAVTSLQAVSRSTPATPAGSVQAVA